jgi:hypothetical protein
MKSQPLFVRRPKLNWYQRIKHMQVLWFFLEQFINVTVLPSSMTCFGAFAMNSWKNVPGFFFHHVCGFGLNFVKFLCIRISLYSLMLCSRQFFPVRDTSLHADMTSQQCCRRIRSCGMWRRVHLYPGTNTSEQLNCNPITIRLNRSEDGSIKFSYTLEHIPLSTASPLRK